MTKHVKDIFRPILIMVLAVFISVFVFSCSVFRHSKKDENGKKQHKENTKKKPPIKRNLCE